MKNTRTPFTPAVGQIYRNKGGGAYECMNADSDHPTMRSTASGWTLIAHGIAIYEDGTIDWDYSTGGFFAK